MTKLFKKSDQVTVVTAENHTYISSKKNFLRLKNRKKSTPDARV